MKLAGYTLQYLIENELNQQKEMGNDVSKYIFQWQEIQNKTTANEQSFREKAIELLDQLMVLPVSRQLQANEPSDLALIKKCQLKTHAILPELHLTNAELSNRIAGGWFGRAAGCLLGKPVEKIPREGIREILKSNNTWDDYGIADNRIAFIHALSINAPLPPPIFFGIGDAFALKS